VNCPLQPPITFMNGEGAITNRELNSSSWIQAQTEKWNRDFKFLIRHTRVLTLLLRHPEVPWQAKLVAACTRGYLFSPVQIIPTFIPIIGQLDDLAVLTVGMKLIRRLAPKSALAECESKGDLKALRHGSFPGA
jgi:uncharacterized membrane protein YkvA (DUF1232 family)